MRGHVPALDGLRGIAILLVLAIHSPTPPSQDWPSLLLTFLQSSGWMGVDLFFVLSGFLIGGILLDMPSRVESLRSFYARRALRIWPLYYVALLLALFVVPAV